MKTEKMLGGVEGGSCSFCWGRGGEGRGVNGIRSRYLSEGEDIQP